MSETADQRAVLRERILEIVMNRSKGWSLGELTDAILAEVPDPRLASGGNFPPEIIEPEPVVETEEERLLQIDPEDLVRIATDDLPALFLLHYPALAERGAEMKAMVDQWQADHKTQAGGWIAIKDDDENAAVADLIQQLDDFAKEVEETRARVKTTVYQAGIQIDSWFKAGLAESVMDVRGVTRTVSGKRYPPGPGTMQFAQTKYLTDKAERERQQRLLAALAAQREADQRADEARRLAKAEQQRIADLQAEGVTSQEAQEIAQSETDSAAAQADAAQDSSSLIGSYTAESAGQMVRQHTASGTTVGLSGKWTFEVTSMAELCLAVGGPALTREAFVQQVAVTAKVGAADVKAVLEAAARLLMPNGSALPATFVGTDDKNIRAAITARTAPLREAPGLRIFQEMSARRRGA